MVVQKIVTLHGNSFVYHYSDAGFYIERDGVKYVDAYDLPAFDYTYTETNEPLPEETREEVMALLEINANQE